MPPHCDTLDGPVVKACRLALERGNVNLALPWAPKEAEAEIRQAFEKATAARKAGTTPREVADLWFFETVVRLHRAGEGAPYTGLKPAGIDPGPVVPRAERAMADEDPSELVEFLQQEVESALHQRFHEAVESKEYDENDVAAARRHVQASLKLTLFSHHLYQFLKQGGEHGEAGHQHEE